MNQDTNRIKSFTDLKTWQEAHKLSLIIYKLTKDFPKEELFGLVSQMRRCVVSIVSNIAEGFSRETYKEKVRFYSIAKGSLTELQSQLLISKDLNYIKKKEFQKVAEQSVKTHKLLNALIKKSKQIQNSKFKIQNSNKGFTLLEIVVVIFVITLGLIGVLSLVLQNIQAQYVNTRTLVASQLAQEGLELVRNARDNNFLDEVWFSEGLVAQDGSDNITVYFDGIDVVITPSVTGIDDNDAQLMIDVDGFYIHGSGDYSGFNRIVVLQNNYADEYTNASSIVQWKDRGKTHQYVVDTVFYDWR